MSALTRLESVSSVLTQSWLHGPWRRLSGSEAVCLGQEKVTEEPPKQKDHIEPKGTHSGPVLGALASHPLGFRHILEVPHSVQGCREEVWKQTRHSTPLEPAWVCQPPYILRETRHPQNASDGFTCQRRGSKH